MFNSVWNHSPDNKGKAPDFQEKQNKIDMDLAPIGREPRKICAQTEYYPAW